MDGRYEIRFDQAAEPSAFVVATPPVGAIVSGNVGVVVEVSILGESQSTRDGLVVACRAGDQGAYYFTVSTTGGWSIQKLPAGRQIPRTLVDSFDEPTTAPIKDVNRLRAVCTGPDRGPVTLTLAVNGVELETAVDRGHELPPGTAGVAVAGPTEASLAGLAVAFDDFRVEEVSTLFGTSGAR